MVTTSATFALWVIVRAKRNCRMISTAYPRSTQSIYCCEAGTSDTGPATTAKGCLVYRLRRSVRRAGERYGYRRLRGATAARRAVRSGTLRYPHLNEALRAVSVA